MTAASYTEDLTDIATGDESSGWSTFSTNQQGSVTHQDNDYPYIQGSYAVCQTCSKSKTIANMAYDNGSDTNPGTDDAIFVWQNFATPTAIDDYAGTTTSGAGMSILIGNSTSNFDIWEVGGSDVPPYPYGGWTCHAVCPSVTADDVSNGPRTSEQVIGAQVRLVAYPSKGEPHSIDVMRYGRGSSIFEHGDLSNGYATISGFAAQNDLSTNRWGLIQEVSGGYLWQGRMQLGTSTNAVDFRDSDVTVFIKYTPKVTANFNTIEVTHTSSRVDMTNMSFICLDPTNTASKGRWISTNDADVNIDGCLFQDMATFTFDSLNDVLNTRFVRCGQVTTGGADMAGSSFLASTAATDTGALYCDTAYTDTDFDGCTFEMGSNSHHAIDFGTSVTSNVTLRNCDFTGFGTGDDANDSTVRFLATSGSLTLSLQNCTVNGGAASESNFSIDDAAGVTVSLSIDPVTVKATCVKTDGTLLQNIRVFAAASAKSSGTADTNTLNKLVDTNATFQTDGVAINDIAFNQTDGTSATVTAVDSETSLSLSSDAFPDGNEDYRVGGAFPDEDTVTIVNSGTTATVTHTAHGMASNDYVYIEGGSLDANEGVYQITYISDNSYSYTMGSSPGSSPTGTITATFVALFGLSNASGVVTTTRVYGTDQPVKGWGRNTASGSPYLQEGVITGTIDASEGLNTSVVLVSDE